MLRCRILSRGKSENNGKIAEIWLAIECDMHDDSEWHSQFYIFTGLIQRKDK
jgi:hypothetical protein